MNYVYNTIHRGNPEAFAKKIRDTYEDACKRFYATIAPFNAIAIIVLDEALDAIEERGMMKHEVKRIAKAIDKQKVQYRTNLLGAMSNRRDGLGKNRYMLIQNMSVELYEEIEHDLFLIGMGIKQVLDKNRVCDSKYKRPLLWQTRYSTSPVSSLMSSSRHTGSERWQTSTLTSFLAGWEDCSTTSYVYQGSSLPTLRRWTLTVTITVR